MNEMYNREELYRDPDVNQACEAELQRLAGIRALEKEIKPSEERLSMRREELRKTWNGIGKAPQLMQTITAESLELDERKVLLEGLKAKVNETMAGICEARVKFFRKRVAWIDSEIARLNKACAPHLKALESILGQPYDLESDSVRFRGIMPGSPNWEKVPLMVKLRHFRFYIEERIDALEGQRDLVTNERFAFEEWCAVHKHSLEGLQ